MPPPTMAVSAMIAPSEMAATTPGTVDGGRLAV
jgi:hypothetical protein